MSTTDKAQQKLVDSMRKTKARSGGAPASAKKAEETKPAASRSKKKASATKAAAKESAKPTAATARQVGADPYQASPRVWPD